jgi:hypothetical protein
MGTGYARKEMRESTLIVALTTLRRILRSLPQRGHAPLWTPLRKSPEFQRPEKTEFRGGMGTTQPGIQ